MSGMSIAQRCHCYMFTCIGIDISTPLCRCIYIYTYANANAPLCLYILQMLVEVHPQFIQHIFVQNCPLSHELTLYIYIILHSTLLYSSCLFYFIIFIISIVLFYYFILFYMYYALSLIPFPSSVLDRGPFEGGEGEARCGGAYVGGGKRGGGGACGAIGEQQRRNCAGM